MAIVTNTCYRYGVDPDSQGIGWIGITGVDWPCPEARTGVVEIIDENDISRLLVLDVNDGLFYDITTREGAVGSGMSRVDKDKVGIGNYGGSGTDIIPRVLTREDRGSSESYYLIQQRLHVYFRPYSDDNKGEEGYDSNGYIDGMTVNVSIYADEEKSNFAAIMKNIDLEGDLSYDKQVRAHRLQTEIIGSAGSHIITGIQSDYQSQDVTANPDHLVTSEMNYQEAFSLPLSWLSNIDGYLYDRASGTAITNIVSFVASPDGSSDAIQFSSTIVLPSSSFNYGTMFMWIKSGDSVSVTVNDELISLELFNSINGFDLYIGDILDKSGVIKIIPIGICTIFDFRAYNSVFSDDEINYYYDDISKNSGNNIMVR